MPLLPPESFDFGNGHSFHANLGEGFFHFLQFEWLNNRFNFFHRCLIRV